MNRIPGNCASIALVKSVKSGHILLRQVEVEDDLPKGQDVGRFPIT